MPDSPGLFTWAAPPSGIGTQTVSDDFARANQTPITGNWTSGGNGMNLVSQTVQPVNFSADSWAIYNAWVSGDNQFSQAEITVVGSGADTGFCIWVRHSSTVGTDTGYRIELNDAGAWQLDKFVAGSRTPLGSGSVTYVAGKKLGISASGAGTTTLKVWYDGVQQGSNVTDSSSPVTTGVPGIGYSSTATSGSIDNWNGGTVP